MIRETNGGVRPNGTFPISAAKAAPARNESESDGRSGESGELGDRGDRGELGGSARSDGFGRVAPPRGSAADRAGASERTPEPPAGTPAQNQKTAPAPGYDRFCGKTDKYGSYVIRSTEKSTIYVDPRFYDSIRNDPEKLREYSDAIGNMKMIDRMQEQKAKAAGKTVVSRGWYIDGDGGIRSWSVVKTEKKIKKTHLEGMRDLQRKLAKKRIARRKAEKKAAEKRSVKKEALLKLEGKKKAAAKERIKRKSRRGTITDPNDLEIMRRARQKNPNAKTSVTTVGSGFSFHA